MREFLFARRSLRRLSILATLLPACMAAAAADAPAIEIDSPDGHLAVRVQLTDEHVLTWAVQRDGQPVLVASRLGLQLEGADLADDFRTLSAGDPKHVIDAYRTAVGKRRHNRYEANERTLDAVNGAGQRLSVTLRMSNDGLAFRYTTGVSTPTHLKLRSERTTFRFPADARSWLQPMDVSKSGWMRTNPSYEEHYAMDAPVGGASPSPAGWVFPALFRSGDTWVALTEAGMDGRWQASRLQPESPGGEYAIGAPMADEVFPDGALLAEGDGALTSPWRVLAIGSLKTLVESTLGTDLAEPARPFDRALVRPGHASWSWPLLKDDQTIYAVQKRFIDYAADMHWDYTLIDADWDKRIGVDKVRELVAYAARKHVGILLWYNSSGPWNDTVYSPKSKLLTHEQRVVEFARLREMGVKGVKIDFFGGDGASMMAYYVAILEDAAHAGLLVNFHGATLPRGWSRTWPNLMTTEAVRGIEYTTFFQADEDLVASHAAMLPFTRNLFDPMDFTPLVFGDIPNIVRKTRNGFELAESVLFLSGIQHFAETPEGMATAPACVKRFLRALPRSWDDTRFIAGDPGHFVVVARRAGNAWIVAGINADDAARPLELDLGFLGQRRGELITDGAGAREFARGTLRAASSAALTLQPHGGFVAVFR
jgi:alpha-glucosidase